MPSTKFFTEWISQGETDLENYSYVVVIYKL